MKPSKKPPTKVKPATYWMIVMPDGRINNYYFGITKAAAIKKYIDVWHSKWPQFVAQGHRCIRVSITPVAGKTKESK